MLSRNNLGYLFLSAVLILCSLRAVAEENTLTLNIPEHGFPPYLINTPTGGIMYDVMVNISIKLGYQIAIINIPEKRAQLLLQQGMFDVHATAPEFQENTEPFIFTDPVVNISDVVFSRKADNFQYQKVEDLFGLTIGTMLGYGYPSLDAYIEQGKITRDDARDETTTLKKLSIGRSDAAIITNLVGLWVLKNNPSLQGKFTISTTTVDTTPLRFMMKKERLPFVKKFNQELSFIKNNGELNRIVSKYTEQ